MQAGLVVPYHVEGGVLESAAGAGECAESTETGIVLCGKAGEAIVGVTGLGDFGREL